jgi:hypothetical protein
MLKLRTKCSGFTSEKFRVRARRQLIAEWGKAVCDR